MPEVRKLLAYGAGVVGCIFHVGAQCYAVSLKGSAARLQINSIAAQLPAVYGCGSCWQFLLAAIAMCLLLLLGAFDPAAVRVSSYLLMPEERKFLAFDDSVVGCADAHWLAVSLKGLAVQSMLTVLHGRVVRWISFVLRILFCNSTPSQRPSATGSSQAMHPQNKRNPPNHTAVAELPTWIEQQTPLFFGCLAWDDPDSKECWLGVLFLYEVADATFDVGTICWRAMGCCCSACVEVDWLNHWSMSNGLS
ncbi:hypothetical protein Nepgr_022782 [Nepenthes gracilis]|uniref:Uncharacterized protein n=1 Tax=Nepenthes gracilis TaxID=150966 RepID=A0AAD3XYH1_NEPGR|nr:hypothetical protein Nepgr_022782 [Nepenthes gracilis]